MSRTVGSALSRAFKEAHNGQQEFSFVRVVVKGKNIFLNLKEIKLRLSGRGLLKLRLFVLFFRQGTRKHGGMNHTAGILE